MSKLSSELTTRLQEFLVEEVGNNVVDGITYALFFNNERDIAKVKKLMELKKDLEASGVGANDVLMNYKVDNGYIFDMNLGVAKKLSAMIVSQVVGSGAVKVNLSTPDLVGDGPDRRRYADIEKLGKYLIKCSKEGKNTVDLALFSKNKVDRIVFNAKNKSGQDVAVKYNAYAIRHWDIGVLNRNLLEPQGLKVVNVEVGEILPPKTGVRVRLTLSK